MMPITAAGRHSVAPMKAPASTTAAMIAAGMSRLDVGDVRREPEAVVGAPLRFAVPARAPRPVCGAGRRWTPDGSVPIWILAGSRRCCDTGPVTSGRRTGPLGSRGRSKPPEKSPGRSKPPDGSRGRSTPPDESGGPDEPVGLGGVDLTSRVGFLGDVLPPHRRLRGERAPHVDVLVEPTGRIRSRLHTRDLARGRIGPMRERTGVVGAEADRSGSDLLHRLGGMVVGRTTAFREQRSTELVGLPVVAGPVVTPVLVVILFLPWDCATFLTRVTPVMGVIPRAVRTLCVRARRRWLRCDGA